MIFQFCDVRNANFLITQSEIKTTTQFGFEVQLSKIYTRAVFAEFKEAHYRSTAFRAEQCPDNPTKYFVHHYNRSDLFDWARHEFQVVADVKNGVYECECKLWTHTGEAKQKKLTNQMKFTCIKRTKKEVWSINLMKFTYKKNMSCLQGCFASM